MEDVNFHLPRYGNTLKIRKSSAAQVHTSDVTLICHEICSHVSVRESEGVTSHDLSIFDGGLMIAIAREKGFLDQKTFKDRSESIYLIL